MLKGMKDIMTENTKSLLTVLQNAPNSEALAGWISLNFDSLEEQIFIEIADTIRITPTLSHLQEKLQTAYAVYQYMGNHQRFRLTLLEELLSEKVRINNRSRNILKEAFEASPESMFTPIKEFHSYIDETFWRDFECFARSLVDDDLTNHMRALQLFSEQLLRDPRMPQIWLAADALTAFESGKDVGYYISQFTEDTLPHLEELVHNVEVMQLKDEEEIAALYEFVDVVKAQVRINEWHSNIVGDQSLQTHFERELAMLRKLSQERSMTTDALSKTVDYAALFDLESDTEITSFLHLAIENDAITMTMEEDILAGALFFSFQANPNRFTVLAVEEIGGKFTDERPDNIYGRLQELGKVCEASELSTVIIEELKSNSSKYILASKVVQREEIYSFLESVQLVVEVREWSPEVLCYSFIDYAAAYVDLGYAEKAQRLLTFALLLVSERLPSYELVSVCNQVGLTFLDIGIYSESLKLCNRAQNLLLDSVSGNVTVLPIHQLNKEEKKQCETMLSLLPLELYLVKGQALTSLGRYTEAEKLLNNAIAYARRLQLTNEEQYSILQGSEGGVEGFLADSSEYLPGPLFSFLESFLFQVRVSQGKENPDLTALADFSEDFIPESGTLEALFAQSELNVAGKFLDATMLLMKGELDRAYAYAWSMLRQSKSRILLQHTLYILAKVELEKGNFLSAQQYVNLSLDFAHMPRHYFSREEVLNYQEVIEMRKGTVGNSSTFDKKLPPYSDTKDFLNFIEEHTATSMGESVSTYINPYTQAKILALRGEITLRLGLYEKALENFGKARDLYTQTQAYIERVDFLTIFGETCLLLGQHDLFKKITCEMRGLVERHIASPVLRQSYLNAIYLLKVFNNRDLEMCREAVKKYETEHNLIKGVNLGLPELYRFKSGGQRHLQIALLAEDKDCALFNQALDSAAEQWMQCFGILLKDFSLPYDFWTGIERLFYFGDTNLVAALLDVFLDSEWLSIIDRKALGEPSFSDLHFIAGAWGILGMALFLVRQKERINRPISEESIELLIRKILAITDSYLPDADHEQWQFYLAKARVLRFLGYTDTAQKYYSKVLEIIEKLRNQLSNQDYRIGFAQNLEEVLMEYVLFSYRYEIAELNEVFAMVEQCRSRAFLDILENANLSFVKGVNPNQVKRVADLQAQIRELLNNSGHIVTPQIRILQMELEDTWQYIQESHPEYLDLFQANSARFKDIRPLIAGQKVVIAEYFTTEDLTLLFIVRADFEEPEVYEITTPLEEIRQFVLANFGTTAGHSQIRNLDLDAWQEQFAPFVDPILQWTDEGDIIWLVPHDVLHYLPLHALKVEGQYLIERNPVCYTPSASVMKYCHAKRKERRDRALILADSRANLPLLHSRAEALAIHQLFAPSAETHTGEAATKTLLKQRLVEAKEDINILHLSCHGYFDPYQALKSGIMLAPENREALNSENDESPELEIAPDATWNLTAEEIFGLELQADLVTLSACESGVNERRPGDELIGLTRALIYAGTPSVLVSLWAVDDISSSILMTKFYTALKAGVNKAKALQHAQIDVMRMTIQDVIAYCEQAKLDLTSRAATEAQRLMEWDIADLQFAARDFSTALESYNRLRQGLNPQSTEYRELTKSASRSRRALRAQSPQPVDYAHPIYAHPYHWAPFVLIGDWK